MPYLVPRTTLMDEECVEDIPLVKYANHALSIAEEQEVRAHLKECDDCDRRYKEIKPAVYLCNLLEVSTDTILRNLGLVPATR